MNEKRLVVGVVKRVGECSQAAGPGRRGGAIVNTRKVLGGVLALLALGGVIDKAGAQTLSKGFNVDGHGGNETFAESIRYTNTYVHQIRADIVDYWAVRYQWDGTGLGGTLVPWVAKTRHSSWTYHWAGLFPQWRKLEGLATFTPIPSGSDETKSNYAEFWDPTFLDGPLPPGEVRKAPGGTAQIQSGHSRRESAPVVAAAADGLDAGSRDAGFPLEDVTALTTISATADDRLRYTYELTNHGDETIDVNWVGLGLAGTLAPGESLSHEFISPLAAVVQASQVLIAFPDIDEGMPWAQPNEGSMSTYAFVVVPEPGTVTMLLTIGGLAVASPGRRGPRRCKGRSRTVAQSGATS